MLVFSNSPGPCKLYFQHTSVGDVNSGVSGYQNIYAAPMCRPRLDFMAIVIGIFLPRLLSIHFEESSYMENSVDIQ